MYGNFSEDALEQYQEILRYLADPSLEFNEDDTYDFTRCIRPNGSSYGTRGVCQPPNKVAPKQDVSAMNQKDFIAGGGLAAVRGGASSTQVVNRGRDARARAFGAGGGMAAMGKGKSREEVERSGSRARAEAFQAGGGASAAKGSRAETVIAQGRLNREAAYKAGGGDASVKAGKSRADVIREGSASLKAAYEAGGGSRKYGTTPDGFGLTDVISQGKENLRRAFEAGGGNAARAQGLSVKEIIGKGKQSLAAAYEAGGGAAAGGKAKDTAARGAERLKKLAAIGGGSVARGRSIVEDPVGASSRSHFTSGGGEAAVARAASALEKRKGGKLNQKEMEDIRARVAGRGAEVLNKYFEDAGGIAGLESGKSVDELIDIGESIAKRAQRRRREEAARNVQARVSRESQVT